MTSESDTFGRFVTVEDSQWACDTGTLPGFLQFTGPTFMQLGPVRINCSTQEISFAEGVAPDEAATDFLNRLIDYWPGIIGERVAAAREDGRQAGLREAAAKIDGMVRWTIGIEEPGETT